MAQTPKTRQPKTTFSTAQYVRNTGRQPKGHGAWAFSVLADLKSGGEERMAGLLFSSERPVSYAAFGVDAAWARVAAHAHGRSSSILLILCSAMQPRGRE